MKTDIKLAWRNLWRNKRRTLIAISSIIFSVLLASWMRSMQEGSYDSMIGNVVKFYSGYLQVQDTAYWEERTLENSMEVPPELKQQIKGIKDVTLVSDRLESFALAANHQHSKPAMVLGIEPEAEDQITAISKKIKEGEFLKTGDNSVVLGRELANFLGLSVGDTLVMIGQGYHGVSANGLFPVKGIIKHPNQDFDKRLVLMDINAARDFYSAYGLSTALVVMTGDHYQVNHLKTDIGNLLSPKNTVLTWAEMQPEIEQLIQSDRGSGIIMLGILYLVIAFGMFSVIMMMVKERRREFGVIHAVGMRKRKMAVVVLFETLFIGIIGCSVGLIVSYLFCLWFYFHPIPLTGEMATATIQYGMEPFMFFSIQPSLFYNQMILVFFISLFIAIFPVISIFRLKITSALRA
ncbi:ABC-type transport system, involved in lipoprotein release, permease component [Mariniphaga anaerophila]|uniref:ABC-type transport system, involved in lipoprotein release, permease component n=1 Tax=Mariniphaga anaerophila TaxID=1484053 RepID=A0A1M4W477_9BACT|nr:FtsX-like permease family protein [Mariniphaga anaerophila]SHE75955.1 ABC-type transport system, involved in lipoprotein release, permease component [Mariniphaga anaerophila]